MVRRSVSVALLVSAVSLFAAVALAAPEGPDGAKHGFNLFHGLIGEKEGVAPSLLWRAPGTQPPLAAMFINLAILVSLLYRFGRQPVQDALKKRKVAITQGMDDAARMKEEAESRLEELEQKLEHIEDEVERVRREMKDTGEAERTRVLAEANERRIRLERDAKVLVDQEFKAARETLMIATIRSAVDSARKNLETSLTAEDHRRLADEHIKSLDSALHSLRGGRA